MPIELRVWQEDESPYALIAKWLAERGIRTGRVAVEETTKYVFFDGLRQAAPSLDYASGNPVTVGCRAQKSAHELELMRLACSVTFDVYKATFASLREGMTQHEVSKMISRAYKKWDWRVTQLYCLVRRRRCPTERVRSKCCARGRAC